MIKLIEYTGGQIFLEAMIVLCFVGTGICGIFDLRRRIKKHDKIKLTLAFTISFFVISAIWIGFILGQCNILNR